VGSQCSLRVVVRWWTSTKPGVVTVKPSASMMSAASGISEGSRSRTIGSRAHRIGAPGVRAPVPSTTVPPRMMSTSRCASAGDRVEVGAFVSEPKRVRDDASRRRVLSASSSTTPGYLEVRCAGSRSCPDRNGRPRIQRPEHRSGSVSGSSKLIPPEQEVFPRGQRQRRLGPSVSFEELRRAGHRPVHDPTARPHSRNGDLESGNVRAPQ